MKRTPRSTPIPARAFGSFAAAVLAALLLSGCAPAEAPSVASLGDAGAADASPSAATAANVNGDPAGLSACMEEQGVPIPPPSQRGNEFTYAYPEDVPIAEVDAALSECDAFLPGGGAPPESDPDTLARLRELAQCMREHGVEDFPDPAPDGVIELPATGGIDPYAPDYVAAQGACLGSGD